MTRKYGAARARCRQKPLALGAALALTTLVQGAVASTIDTDVPGLKINWDNTFKHSAAARLRSPDQKLLSQGNNDDGDRNFSKGLISNRVDLLSELDVQHAMVWGESLFFGANAIAGGMAPERTSSNFGKQKTRRSHRESCGFLDFLVLLKTNSWW